MSYLLTILNVPNLPLENDLLRQRNPELLDLTRKPGTDDSIYVFIDNSNVYTQGKRVTSTREDVWEHLIDYGELVETIQQGRTMGAIPFAVGSIPPPEDTIWKYLKNLGYDVTVFKRNFEKNVFAGDGDYGPAIREALDKNWNVEIWFLQRGLNHHRIANMHKYKAMALPTTIMKLDDYYKKFMFARECAKVMYLEIFTDILVDNDIIKFYGELDFFSWWFKKSPNTLKLYVNNYSQWKDLKDLIMNKYPDAKEMDKDAFCLEKDTFFKMDLSFLKG